MDCFRSADGGDEIAGEIDGECAGGRVAARGGALPDDASPALRQVQPPRAVHHQKAVGGATPAQGASQRVASLPLLRGQPQRHVRFCLSEFGK